MCCLAIIFPAITLLKYTCYEASFSEDNSSFMIHLFSQHCILLLGQACSVGYYSLEGHEACIPCPGGSECSDQTAMPVLCLAGTYAPPANDTCISCEAGYKCPTDGLSDHVACADGYYQENTDQTSCNQCQQGKIKFRPISKLYAFLFGLRCLTSHPLHGLGP